MDPGLVYIQWVRQYGVALNEWALNYAQYLRDEPLSSSQYLAHKARVGYLSRLESKKTPFERDETLACMESSANTPTTVSQDRAQSTPAPRRLSINPYYFDAVGRRENELSIGLSGPYLAKFQPETDDYELFNRPNEQNEGSQIVERETEGGNEWVLVAADTRAEEEFYALNHQVSDMDAAQVVH